MSRRSQLGAVGNAAAYASAIIADAPRGYWRMDDSSGTTAADSFTGGANPGTYNGGYTLGQTGAISDGKSVQFDGTSGRVNIPHASTFNVTDIFSIEAWVKFASTAARPGPATIFSKGIGAPALRIATDGTLELMRSQAALLSTSSVKITDTAWHHVVAVRSGGSSVGLYIDNVAVTATNTGSPCTNNTVFLSIGSDSGNPGTVNPAEFFPGYLDEVAFYSYLLSPTQIANHWALR